MNAPPTTVDFAHVGTVRVTSTAALQELFASRTATDAPVRLCGTATQQHAVPAPTTAPLLVSLAGIDSITRLEPDDFTCSVGPGLPRAELDAALRARGLRLSCEPSHGTLGGLFAHGHAAHPAAPGPSGRVGTRALLLGLTGVLAEGRVFKAGARVVKSVAGFDLQKLFVGSRGRLFAATELHLKLRPLPRTAVGFAVPFDDPLAAARRFAALRADDCPPAALYLVRDHATGSVTVRGVYEGASRVVAGRLRAHALVEAAEPQSTHTALAPFERISGLIAPSRVDRLLAALPPRADLIVNGTGWFELIAATESTDDLLTTLADLGAHAEIDVAAPHRRGLATARDPGAANLESRLKAALDPGAILT